MTFYGAGGQPLDARLTYIKAYYWSHYSGVRESCRFSYENSYDGECGAKNNLLQVELPETPDLVLDNNGDKTPEQQVARLRSAALGLEG